MAAHDLYEVWSVASGSVLVAYPTEDEALRFVRANLDECGADVVQGLMVVNERRGRSKVLWQGDALVERVRRTPAEPDIRRLTG